MSELNFLISSYSGGELILILVAVLLAAVGILKALSYLWDKAKEYFGMKNAETNWKDGIVESLDTIKKDTKELRAEVSNMQDAAKERADRLKQVEEYVRNDFDREQKILDQIEQLTKNMTNIREDMDDMTDRLQDDARWAFKDAQNYYVLHRKCIDPLSLEALENKYEHYKKYNDNTYVHDVMEQIRRLPLIPYGEGENDGNGA